MNKNVYEAPACKELEILKITMEGLEELIQTARSNKIVKLLKEQDKLQNISKHD